MKHDGISVPDHHAISGHPLEDTKFPECLADRTWFPEFLTDRKCIEEEKPALAVQVGGGHYKDMAIQPIEFVHANNIPFIEASCIKYLCRWRDKGGHQDLDKVKHLIDMLKELEPEDG